MNELLKSFATGIESARTKIGQRREKDLTEEEIDFYITFLQEVKKNFI